MSRMTEKGKKRPWISDQVRNDRKGTDTSGSEKLGYQRTKRVDGRSGLSLALRLGGRLVFVGFLRCFLFTMKTSVQDAEFTHDGPSKGLSKNYPILSKGCAKLYGWTSYAKPSKKQPVRNGSCRTGRQGGDNKQKRTCSGERNRTKPMTTLLYSLGLTCAATMESDMGRCWANPRMNRSHPFSSNSPTHS